VGKIEWAIAYVESGRSGRCKKGDRWVEDWRGDRVMIKGRSPFVKRRGDRGSSTSTRGKARRLSDCLDEKIDILESVEEAISQ